MSNSRCGESCRHAGSERLPDTFLPAEGASPEELHRCFQRQAVLTNSNTYRLLVLIRRMDACDGHRQFGCVTLQQYVSLTCGITAVAARERIRVALALADLPDIEAAMARGELSYSKVRAVTRVATADNEAEWLDAMRKHTAEEIEVMVARSHRGRPLERRLFMRPLDRDTTRMVVDLPVEEMQLIRQALEAICKQAGAKLSMSEALTMMAADSLAGDPQPVQTAERYMVVVHAEADGTAWVDTEHGEAPLRPEVVDRLLCDCSMRLAREDEQGEMALSLRQRTIPLVTRRAVELRDRRCCRVPGCGRRLWLDLHHLEQLINGGTHRRDNLCLLCTQHHQMVHDGLLIIEKENGELVFRAANGWRLGAGGEMFREVMDVDVGEELIRTTPAHDPEESGRPRRWRGVRGGVMALPGDVSAETSEPGDVPAEIPRSNGVPAGSGGGEHAG